LFKTEIGGGLNNMIMNVAQLTSDTCMRGERPKEVLVLPRFTTGKNFFKKRGEKYNNESMPFGELFDAHHFMRQMRPCRFAESVPEGARWRYINVVGISKTLRAHAPARVQRAACRTHGGANFGAVAAQGGGGRGLALVRRASSHRERLDVPRPILRAATLYTATLLHAH
jgi:hypothetical protein